MLDVHPAHHAASTRRDFFIHIATIVIGLLIAIGLERGVEYLHHIYQIRETRHLLKQERAHNVERFHHDVTFTRRLRAQLENNLRIFQYLQVHPGTPLQNLPGVLGWGDNEAGSSQASWMTAKQNNVLALMPQAEVEESRTLYDHLTRNDDAAAATWQALNKAGAYQFIQPDPTKLTPAQVDAEISLLQDCLRLTFLRAVELNNIGLVIADFAPGPSEAELNAFLRDTVAHPEKDFPTAWAFTQHDLDNAAALDATDKPGIQFAKENTVHGPAHLVEAYEQIHSKYPDFKPQENTLNAAGYSLVAKADLPAAITVMKLNAQLYSNSWNVYDSLGEVYARSGNKVLAIENYQHALKLDPHAQSSLIALKKLQQ